MEMWIGEYHFNDEERVSIWNESLFKPEFFKQDEVSWNSYRQRAAWQALKSV